jgi:chemotaxis protein MotB
MRRRPPEDHENHERWLVSYADFITLLFAFFVVMYSISSINEGKYRVFSESLDGIFNQPDRSFKPINVGEMKPRAPTSEGDRDQDAFADSDTQDEPLAAIARSVSEAFGDLIDAQQLTLRGSETWLEIELSSALLFPSGDALPHDAAFAIVEKIARILAPFENPIQVEGFTDNVAISTSQYPTNWELSAARAASVVRMLAIDGVEPSRMAAVGYGEFQPVTDNDSAEGRSRNRRVVLVISRNLEIRRNGTELGASAKPNQGSGTVPAAIGEIPAPEAGAVNSSSPAAAGGF